tara:strand:- start:467 stop:604 length:138 start_codon:yes stop_codon:yes gene_type:complete
LLQAAEAVVQVEVGQKTQKKEQAVEAVRVALEKLRTPQLPFLLVL